MNAPYDISLIIDTQGEIIHSGDATAQKTGLSVDMIIGKCIWDILDPQVSKYFKEWLNKVLTDKKPLRVENNQTLGEGLPAIYDTWSYPILDAAGEVTFIVIMSRENSALQQAQQEPYQSKRKLEAILDNVDNRVFLIDQSGDLIYANQGKANQIIYPLSDLKSAPKKFFDRFIVLDADGNPFSREKLPGSAALRGEQAPPVILRYKLHEAQAEHWLIIRATPVFDENGNIKYAAIITSDITDLKQAQLEVEKAHQELEKRIAIRTSELSRAIQGLQKEIGIRKEAEQQAHENAAHAQALARIAQHLSAQLDLKTVLNTICREAAQVVVSMPTSLASVFLYNQEQDAFIKSASYSVRIQPDFWTTVPREIYETWLKAYVTTILVPNINDLEHIDAIDLPKDFPNSSYLSVSMWSQGEIIGYLSLLFLDEDQLPSESEVALIEAIASQATTAIINSRLFEEVTAARNRLQQVSQKMVQVQENERRYLARELHDEIGGLLTSLRINLDMIAQTQKHTKNNPLAQAQELAEQLINHIRELSLDLRPTMLDDLGLLPALLSFFEQYSMRTNIVIDFKHNGIKRRFPPQIETTAFRSIQEALTNIARHADVDYGAVRIWVKDNLLKLQVQDEGKGFDLQEFELNNRTSGLSGMRERVNMVQGSLEIETFPGQGTCLSEELPLLIIQERNVDENFDTISR